ncbi:MAG: peroxiredoxin family protein [Planctomycetota bacterium]
MTTIPLGNHNHCLILLAAIALFGIHTNSAFAAPVIQDGKPASVLATEWKTLEGDFRKAQMEYYKPYENVKTQEDYEKIKLDAEKEPGKLFAPKVKDFAIKARGADEGLNAVTWILQLAPGIGSKPLDWQVEVAKFAVDEIVNNYLKNPKLGRATGLLIYLPRVLGKTIVSETLTKIEAEAPLAETKASAAFSLVNLSESMEMEFDAKPDAARISKLENLIKKYPGTQSAKRAEGEIFEASHLQIGQTAPEILGTDHAGKEFKLSDYRGKVVVLDFWGMW